MPSKACVLVAAFTLAVQTVHADYDKCKGSSFNLTGFDADYNGWYAEHPTRRVAEKPTYHLGIAPSTTAPNWNDTGLYYIFWCTQGGGAWAIGGGDDSVREQNFAGDSCVSLASKTTSQDVFEELSQWYVHATGTKEITLESCGMQVTFCNGDCNGRSFAFGLDRCVQMRDCTGAVPNYYLRVVTTKNDQDESDWTTVTASRYLDAGCTKQAAFGVNTKQYACDVCEGGSSEPLPKGASFPCFAIKALQPEEEESGVPGMAVAAVAFCIVAAVLAYIAFLFFKKTKRPRTQQGRSDVEMQEGELPLLDDRQPEESQRRSSIHSNGTHGTPDYVDEVEDALRQSEQNRQIRENHAPIKLPTPREHPVPPPAVPPPATPPRVETPPVAKSKKKKGRSVSSNQSGGDWGEGSALSLPKAAVLAKEADKKAEEEDEWGDAAVPVAVASPPAGKKPKEKKKPKKKVKEEDEWGADAAVPLQKKDSEKKKEEKEEDWDAKDDPLPLPVPVPQKEKEKEKEKEEEWDEGDDAAVGTAKPDVKPDDDWEEAAILPQKSPKKSAKKTKKQEPEKEKKPIEEKEEWEDDTPIPAKAKEAKDTPAETKPKPDEAEEDWDTPAPAAAAPAPKKKTKKAAKEKEDDWEEDVPAKPKKAVKTKAKEEDDWEEEQPKLRHVEKPKQAAPADDDWEETPPPKPAAADDDWDEPEAAKPAKKLPPKNTPSGEEEDGWEDPPASKAKAKPAKKAAAEDDWEEEAAPRKKAPIKHLDKQDDDWGAEERPVLRKVGLPGAKKAAEEDDWDEPAAKPTKKPAKEEDDWDEAPAKKPVKEDDWDETPAPSKAAKEDDDWGESAPATKPKPKPKAKAKPAKKAAEDDWEEEAAPRKKAPIKHLDKQDDDWGAEERPVLRKVGLPGAKKAAEEDDWDEPAAKPTKKPAKEEDDWDEAPAKKPVKEDDWDETPAKNGKDEDWGDEKDGDDEDWGDEEWDDDGVDWGDDEDWGDEGEDGWGDEEPPAPAPAPVPTKPAKGKEPSKHVPSALDITVKSVQNAPIPKSDKPSTAVSLAVKNAPDQKARKTRVTSSATDTFKWDQRLKVTVPGSTFPMTLLTKVCKYPPRYSFFPPTSHLHPSPHYR